MCGIAGIFSPGPVDPALLGRMAGAIAHRGPDDEGVWHDDDSGVGFAHRRLAIIDLTSEGHQPMHSADGRFTICFNGEIYNFREMRAELEARGMVPEGGWRGHSDTEVLLQSLVAWGLESTLGRAVGMFAFALWDRRERQLHLVRDRFGEKPLYYGWAGKDLVFGSELKALRCHPNFEARIDRRALGAYAARTCVPAPFSIYRGVFKLMPGTTLTLSREALANPLVEPPAEGVHESLQVTRYWSYREVVRQGLDDPILDEAEALEALEQLLSEAIRGQSLADVPVGAFLSGGIDSSTIVSLYQKHSPRPVHTYSIGFEETGFDEARHAKEVAAQLGTLHHEHYVTVKEARDVIPLLPAMYDEPFADSSQIPTCLVSRFARRNVTVALTGDGGDELFGGYNRHVIAPRFWKQMRKMPRPLRSLVAGTASRLPPAFWHRQAQPSATAKIQKGLRIAQSASTIDDIYLKLLDEWELEGNPVLSMGHLSQFNVDLGRAAPDALRMMYFDTISYLPDDILCKVDRASMAVSLETRLPFLDHRLATLAARIPIELKIRHGQGKHILRKLLYRHVRRKAVERPKAGFAVPVGEWIKGPLRPWAEELLDRKKLVDGGWFDAEIVHGRWREHLSGRRDSTPALWAILMFQAWLKEQGAAISLAA